MLAGPSCYNDDKLMTSLSRYHEIARIKGLIISVSITRCMTSTVGSPRVGGTYYNRYRAIGCH